jgi:RNA polymerase sigma-70 factor (ECF subfamily)
MSMTSTIPDQEILALLEQDARRGIRLLFEKYYTLLVVYAEHLLHDRGRAEDVVQELVIHLWSDASGGRLAIRSLPAYLYAGVRNACFTALSSKDFTREATTLPDVEIPLEVFTGIDDERMTHVLREIDRLPERTRIVVRAVMLEEQKYKEVAARLSISINTVKFLLKKGIRRLRERLASGRRDILLFLFSRLYR